jgi:hypothetical protein
MDVVMTLEEGSVDTHAVTAWTPRRELADPNVLSSVALGTLLILPDKFSDDGKPQYRDDNAGLVKTAKANGFALEYSFSREQRQLLSEYSAGAIVANILLGVAGIFAADGIKMVVNVVRLRVRAALHNEDREVEEAVVRLRIAEYSSGPDWKVVRGLEYSGPVAGVEKALLEALESPSQLDNAKKPIEPGGAGASE